MSLDSSWHRICEVLSPSTAATDRADELPIYAREGVAHAWRVDPLAQSLEVLRLESNQWSSIATHQENAVIRAQPFAAVELELGVLWMR